MCVRCHRPHGSPTCKSCPGTLSHPSATVLKCPTAHTHRPELVTGREVPGRFPPRMAASRLAVPLRLLLLRPVVPVVGRAPDEPGRENPVRGRPLLVIGRTAWLGAPCKCRRYQGGGSGVVHS